MVTIVGVTVVIVVIRVVKVEVMVLIVVVMVVIVEITVVITEVTVVTVVVMVMIEVVIVPIVVVMVMMAVVMVARVAVMVAVRRLTDIHGNSSDSIESENKIGNGGCRSYTDSRSNDGENGACGSEHGAMEDDEYLAVGIDVEEMGDNEGIV